MRNPLLSSSHGGRPARAAAPPPVHPGEVHVLFTSIDDTLRAAAVAEALARRMDAPLTLTHLRLVPFRIPVDQPAGISPVETEDFGRAWRTAASGGRIRIVLCRDDRRAIASAFAPHSVIVLAGRRSWWPTAMERRIRALEAAGHRVVVVNPRAGEPPMLRPRDGTSSPESRLVTFPRREQSHA